MTSANSKKRVYRYYDLVMASFVTVLLCTNIIGAAKITTVKIPLLGNFTFSAAVLFFPLSYIFGDILTEVYGYARARKVVWAGFGAMAFASLMASFAVWLPPAEGYANQSAVAAIFGQTPRIALASLVAFFCGEFVNSYVLAKMKIRTSGRHLWMRTIGSTIFGELVDSMIFYPLAFYGSWPNELLIHVFFTNYLLKVGCEVVMTPVTYVVVNTLKTAENEDYYDRTTDFTPFSLKT